MRLRNGFVAMFCVIALIYISYQIGFGQYAVNLMNIIIPTPVAEEVVDVEDENQDQTVAEQLAIVSDNVLEALPFKDKLIKLSGKTLKCLDMRGYYGDSYNIFISEDGYCVGRYAKTSTDYEVEQMQRLKEELDKKGVQLLYVNEPVKYIDDSWFENEFGGETYLNKNADLFLNRIGNAGIEYLDLREPITQQQLDCMKMYYRTDHHWTVPTSKWAAKQVSNKLNEVFDAGIDTSLFEDVHFSVEPYPNTWLGEQGQKVGETYMGLDDYFVIFPNYPTSYTIYDENNNVFKQGGFECFVDHSLIDNREKTYNKNSWHYIYNPYAYYRIHNDNIDGKKVLVIGDSYQASMAPFLSLGLEELTVIVPREMQVSPWKFIDQGDYDIVVVAYTQFMLGAHEDKNNANYKMFSFWE